MKRRVGIAQALLADPQLLIVDEPTAGLDPEERIRFRTLLSGLASSGRTVLLSTHIVDDVAQTCTRLAVLRHGHVLFAGNATDLTSHAAGRVWALTTHGPAPAVGTVINARQIANGIEYRLIADHQPEPRAQHCEPSLEDGYIALMTNARNDANGGHR